MRKFRVVVDRASEESGETKIIMATSSLPLHELASFYGSDIGKTSVVDPKLFIPDPDPALNFPSSGSGTRQKIRIHADPDPTFIDKVSKIRNNTKKT